MSTTEPRPIAATLGKTVEQILAEQQADPDALAALADVDRAATAAEDVRRADADRERAIAAAWYERIPPRFSSALLGEGVDMPADCADDLTRWADCGVDYEDCWRNVVILGPVGVGKTHLAVALAWERHRRGELVRFWPVVELLDALRPGGDDDAAASARDAKVLILDDLGAERPTDWTAERLYALVNRRWLNELPTIVTSNLAPDQLRTSIGERLYSRLAHEAIAVRLTGNDRRRT